MTMNGLELILRKIEEDNKLEVEKIKADGKKAAENIVADAEASAKSEAAKIIAAADKKASLMLENAKSGCDSLIKRAEVFAKSQVVTDCIKNATAEIKAMEDDKYFQVITKLVLKYYHANEQGELLMNEKDIDRMPKRFLKDINEKIKKSGAELVLSKNPADIDSGFVIRYGGVEENCTFDSLINEKTEEIKDKLYSQLMA